MVAPTTVGHGATVQKGREKKQSVRPAAAELQGLSATLVMAWIVAQICLLGLVVVLGGWLA